MIIFIYSLFTLFGVHLKAQDILILVKLTTRRIRSASCARVVDWQLIVKQRISSCHLIILSPIKRFMKNKYIKLLLYLSAKIQPTMFVSIVLYSQIKLIYDIIFICKWQKCFLRAMINAETALYCFTNIELHFQIW